MYYTFGGSGGGGNGGGSTSSAYMADEYKYFELNRNTGQYSDFKALLVSLYIKFNIIMAI